MTIRLMLEPTIVGNRTVALAMLPSVIVGDAVICEVTGGGADDYTVVEVLPGVPTNRGNQAATVARGVFEPSLLPASFYR